MIVESCFPVYPVESFPEVVVLEKTIPVSPTETAESIYEHGMKELQQGNYGLARTHFLQAGESGHALSLFQLGRLYELGLGVEEDSGKAVFYYRLAADRGETDSMVCLGSACETGSLSVGGKPDMVQALSWYKKAAFSGNAEGKYRLGVYYLKGGGGLKVDRKKGISLLGEAAEAGNVNACYHLGVVSEEVKDYRRAVLWYEYAAEQDHPAAFYALGKLYSAGLGVEKDLVRAGELFRRAAELGGGRVRGDPAQF